MSLMALHAFLEPWRMKSGGCNERAPGADPSSWVEQASILHTPQAFNRGVSQPPEKAANTLQPICVNPVRFPFP